MYLPLLSFQANNRGVSQLGSVYGVLGRGFDSNFLSDFQRSSSALYLFYMAFYQSPFLAGNAILIKSLISMSLFCGVCRLLKKLFSILKNSFCV